MLAITTFFNISVLSSKLQKKQTKKYEYCFKKIYIFMLLVNVCPVWFQVDKTCNSPVTSSCENSYRAKCPSSLPLVSVSLSDVFIQGVYIYFTFSVVMKDLKKPCSHVIQYLLTQCVVSIVYFPVCALQDFSRDFSDLDGVVQQRRQEMMESSSSGSQTPDYDKITGVCTVLTFMYTSALYLL